MSSFVSLIAVESSILKLVSNLLPSILLAFPFFSSVLRIKSILGSVACYRKWTAWLCCVTVELHAVLCRVRRYYVVLCIYNWCRQSLSGSNVSCWLVNMHRTSQSNMAVIIMKRCRLNWLPVDCCWCFLPRGRFFLIDAKFLCHVPFLSALRNQSHSLHLLASVHPITLFLVFREFSFLETFFRWPSVIGSRVVRHAQSNFSVFFSNFPSRSDFPGSRKDLLIMMRKIVLL